MRCYCGWKTKYRYNFHEHYINYCPLGPQVDWVYTLFRTGFDEFQCWPDCNFVSHYGVPGWRRHFDEECLLFRRDSADMLRLTEYKFSEDNISEDDPLEQVIREMFPGPVPPLAPHNPLTPKEK